MIGAVTGEQPVVWATRELGVPLGIPSIFLYDGLTTGDISAGGGQLYTCRDAARVGQLIASGGVWADADGKEMRMMSAEFARGFVQPSFPEINPAYGFLTWLNTDVEKLAPGVHCCAPRWGHAAVVKTAADPAGAQCCKVRDQAGPIPPGYMCNLSSTTLNEHVASTHISPGEPRSEWMERVGSAYIGTQMIGDNIAGTFPAPSTLATAMGCAKQPPLLLRTFLVCLCPESSVSFHTQELAEKNVCRLFLLLHREAARYLMIEPESELTVVSLGSAKGWATNCWGGYDDAYTVALVWNLLGPAVQPRMNMSQPERDAIAQLLASETKRLVAERTSGAVPDDVDGRKAQEEIGEAAKKAVAASGIEIQGSCECYCKAESGRGVCFNVGVGAGVPTKDKVGREKPPFSLFFFSFPFLFFFPSVSVLKTRVCGFSAGQVRLTAAHQRAIKHALVHGQAGRLLLATRHSHAVRSRDGRRQGHLLHRPPFGVTR